MKGQPDGIASCLIGVPEGACDQMSACVAGHPIADDPAGEKVEDHTKVEPVVVDFEICNITDPDLVGTLRDELLLQ